jgi:hypothetical protein
MPLLPTTVPVAAGAADALAVPLMMLPSALVLMAAAPAVRVIVAVVEVTTYRHV